MCRASALVCDVTRLLIALLWFVPLDMCWRRGVLVGALFVLAAELGGFGGLSGKFDVSVKIAHEGEVNRARYCPQNSFWIATKTVSGEVHVFDYSKHPSQPADAVSRPEVRCQGHTKEGYGLDWSPHTEGSLLSGSDDHTICTWDIKSTSSKASATLQPTRVFKAHTSVVEDVAWHRHHKSLFGSVGDDHKLMMYACMPCA